MILNDLQIAQQAIDILFRNFGGTEEAIVDALITICWDEEDAGHLKDSFYDE